MKKNRALSRCYLGAYIVWLFGAILAPLVLNYWGAAISIICVIFVCITLAALITSHVFYSKLPQAYAPVSFVGHGLNTVLVIAGFIGEILLTTMGKAAPYAWMIAPIALALLIPIDIFVIRCNLKYMKHLPARAKKEEKKEEEKPAEEPAAE